ncbi:MAG: tRNA uridine-5-carboxymethylaminomethyl(34) synthesis GTPase MnmE [Candidatus Omnitrophica bacterium CG07_land_8_20_14_0_80_42_15]|uniref:tRNA modification GTPase MnmE n=1 Tax=Candidatus Aquitaenariimonas noxiae TaxID=1974741 RepID=A0A2J0KVT3_9BACT|nr:MAG: tRNA uridine-5-carboxymethylaminomethyl(34) synthesis GTPase MnmE [Candidatus Omnitrophica bacterium CG07_land_8_20_14_0_80_42_15]
MGKKIGLDDTIVAISTPVGEGGIGIVRLSGKEALSIADKIFLSRNGTRPSKVKTYTTHYGHIVKNHPPSPKASADVRRSFNEGGQKSKTSNLEPEVIDEVILTVMRSPKSYTKEDTVEINCHGGIVPLKRTLELVMSLGARLAEPGEFTKRAFLNGRIDLSQAEAVLDIIRSKTDASLKAALGQLEGKLSKEIRGIRETIMNFYIHVEAAVDFPEEDIQIFNSIELSKNMEGVLKKLKALIESSECGKVLREGVSMVICGKTNVGKSTLMNAFLKEDRVIVTPIPGTTRDVIEEVINIKGIPLRVADTAGIIDSSCLIEKESIAKTKKCINDSDLILLLLDNSRELSAEDKHIIDIIKDKKTIIVVNKIDLPNKLNLKKVKSELPDKKSVEISAAKGLGMDVLEKTILRMVWNGEVFSSNDVLVTNVRHTEAIKKAYEYIGKAKESLSKGLSPEFIALDIKESLNYLGEVIGEMAGEELLNRIFGEFCIGK